MRTELPYQRMRRRMTLVAVAALAGPLVLAPRVASAEDLFGFLFGGGQRQQQRQASLHKRNRLEVLRHDHLRLR